MPAGACAVLSACRDLLQLACAPLTAAHCATACLLRMQLHYVRSMWGLMRGGVRRPQRFQVGLRNWLECVCVWKGARQMGSGECI